MFTYIRVYSVTVSHRLRIRIWLAQIVCHWLRWSVNNITWLENALYWSLYVLLWSYHYLSLSMLFNCCWSLYAVEASTYLLKHWLGMYAWGRALHLIRFAIMGYSYCCEEAITTLTTQAAVSKKVTYIILTKWRCDIMYETPLLCLEQCKVQMKVSVLHTANLRVNFNVVQFTSETSSD